MQRATEKLLEFGARSVMLTGGHFEPQHGKRLDYWSNGEESFWLAGEDVQTVNNHGSGCTLSSAIAAAVAQGYALADALVVAKAYVTQGIRHAMQVGSGPGPVGHYGWPDDLQDLPTLSFGLPKPALEFAACGDNLGLYPVVDSAAWVARLAPLGVTTLQLRIKDKTGDALTAELSAAIASAKTHNVRLFINDYWQQAIELGAYGVHLGQEDLDTADLAAIAAAGLRLGVSTHSYYEIARAHGVRPSYIALGPVYETTTKAMAFAPLGLAQLEEWVDLLAQHYPLTAIGGISEPRVNDVLWTGVGSCAMVTAITEADDPEAVVARLLQAHQSSELDD
jgi:hydroxymethylpyrimidine kinase/phosphomethylpyrimidine kinase/thiamine-phosphate diphosphorylase